MRCSLCADHICICDSSSSLFVIQEKFQGGLGIVDTFLKEREMDLSISKLVVLPFTLKLLKGLYIPMQEQPIEQVRVHRFLWIYI